MTAGPASAGCGGALRWDVVGIVSAGEMGTALGRSLRAAGLRVVTYLRGRSERTQALAADAGMESLSELADVLAEADLFLSLVPPAHALPLARAVAGSLAEVTSPLLYADCNSIAPRTVDSIGGLITRAGARFADVSIIGQPPRLVDGRIASGPRIYASGEGAEDFADLYKYGLDVHVLEGSQSRASSLKMCYAGLFKGLTALSAELLAASELLEVREAVMAQLSATQPTLLGMMEKQVPAMPPKARRWVGEMEQMAITFADVGLTPKTFQGAAELFDLVGRTELGDEIIGNRRAGTSMEEVVDVIAETVRNGSALSSNAASPESAAI
jgi:3-hydroxyisobutyrate dehydrogenase-like beta-hydroxyacid dehydrogenase